jgi:hypothetical protein
VKRRARAPSPTGRGDVVSSLVLCFPLLLAYEIGVLFTGRVSGADVITRALYATTGSRTAYLLLHALVAVGFLAWMQWTHRWLSLRASVAAPVILEASLYALTLGAAISLVLTRALGLGAGGDIVSAIGAGVHEELVFRLLAMYLIVRALARIARPGPAVGIALATSALLFAAAHHLGAHGEPFTMHAFVFRALAGAAFGAIFWFRSLAHAVYAHVLYDVLVALT